MITLLVAYTLRQSGHDYAPFYAALTGPGTAMQLFETIWLLQTYETPTYWRDTLAQHLDQADSLVVLTVCREWSTANLPPDKVYWMHQNLRGQFPF